eukprot:CFRG8140T1
MIESVNSSRKNRVTYFYDTDIGSAYYGNGHPMKPHRVRMAHSLVMNYGMFRHMDILTPQKASKEELLTFHSPDYIDFLERITPASIAEEAESLYKYSVFEDCPVFPGLYNFCQSSAGGSIGGAVALNNSDTDIAINWSGGLHHAMRTQASGFCYVNDIVLGILELLKRHPRVLYIDIDVHHGDGVEVAFYGTNRVMTLSFHKYGGGFFPQTGNMKHNGVAEGKGYAMNIPLQSHISDDEYLDLFRMVVGRVMQTYSPSVIVLQCGADSLAGDKLGVFNLSSQGHAECVRFMKSFGLPLLLLGGGGYSIDNVAKCWALETSVAAGVEVSQDLPDNDFYMYYGPYFKLNVESDPMTLSENTPQYLNSVYERVCEQLRGLDVAPGIPFNETPKSVYGSVVKRSNSDVVDSTTGHEQPKHESYDQLTFAQGPNDAGNVDLGCGCSEGKSKKLRIGGTDV